MDVGEQDFHHFKRDQHILVEFNVFPIKMIELIHLCLSQTSSDGSSFLITKITNSIVSSVRCLHLYCKARYFYCKYFWQWHLFNSGSKYVQTINSYFAVIEARRRLCCEDVPGISTPPLYGLSITTGRRNR